MVTELALVFAGAYLICGAIVLCYEMLADSEAVSDIREHGWPLVAVVVIGWPVFVWQVLRDEL